MNISDIDYADNHVTNITVSVLKLSRRSRCNTIKHIATMRARGYVGLVMSHVCLTNVCLSICLTGHPNMDPVPPVTNIKLNIGQRL